MRHRRPQRCCCCAVSALTRSSFCNLYSTAPRGIRQRRLWLRRQTVTRLPSTSSHSFVQPFRTMEPVCWRFIRTRRQRSCITRSPRAGLVITWTAIWRVRICSIPCTKWQCEPKNRPSAGFAKRNRIDSIPVSIIASTLNELTLSMKWISYWVYPRRVHWSWFAVAPKNASPELN